MYQSRFNWLQNLGKGTQPVSVLQHNIVHYLEKMTPTFGDELRQLVLSAGLKPGLRFNCTSQPISVRNEDLEWETHAASVDEDNHIEFHETFLSYLWIISYALIVLYDEGNVKPAKRIASSSQVLKQARRLLRYGLMLRKEFKPWRINSVPNPQKYDAGDREYIEKANGIFCIGTAFVLLHEIAHVHLGHTDLLKKRTHLSTHDKVTHEIAADKWAIEKIKEGLGNQMDTTKCCGVVAGLVALLLMSPSLLGGEHPDRDDRLRDGLKALDLPETSNIWSIALVGIRIWEQTYEQPIVWPTVKTSPKDYFLRVVAELGTKKSYSLFS
jgi:hypothetical protein